MIESILQRLQLNSTDVVVSNYHESWHGVDAGGPTSRCLGRFYHDIGAKVFAGKQSFTTRFAIWLPTRQTIAKQTPQSFLACSNPTHLQTSNAPQIIAWTVILTRLLLITNHTRLRPNIIRALMAVGSWDKEGIIDIVDGQLKRPQKEGTGHTR